MHLRRLLSGCFAALILCLMTLPSPTSFAQVAGLTTLAALHNQARPLLIFARKPDDSQMGIQLRILDEHAAQARDRQIVPLALPYHSPAPSALQLSDTDAEAARRRFHVAPSDFVVILLGKDGGVKLRSSKPISMEKLDDTVDAMPMRKGEMRGQPKS